MFLVSTESEYRKRNLLVHVLSQFFYLPAQSIYIAVSLYKAINVRCECGLNGNVNQLVNLFNAKGFDLHIPSCKHLINVDSRKCVDVITEVYL